MQVFRREKVKKITCDSCKNCECECECELCPAKCINLGYCRVIEDEKEAIEDYNISMLDKRTYLLEQQALDAFRRATLTA